MARKDAPKTPVDLQPPPPKPKCERCPDDAQMSKMIDQRRVNLCFKCEKRSATEEAERNCAAKGLHTPEDCRRWLTDHKLLVKRAPVLEREPGCDDE